MACLRDAVDLLDAERVGADPADLLEIQRAPAPTDRARAHQPSPRSPVTPSFPRPGRTSPAFQPCRRRRQSGPGGSWAGPAMAAAGRPPPQATSSWIRASRGSGASTLAAPEAGGPTSPWALKRATTATSSIRWPRLQCISAQHPSDTAPYTSTRPDGGGGCEGDRVKGHRERVGEHCQFVGHRLRDRGAACCRRQAWARRDPPVTSADTPEWIPAP